MAADGGYYGQARPELVAVLPRPLGRVLDVGCGEGGAATGLRAVGATWISGIELNTSAALKARDAYDEAVCGRVEESLAAVTGPFDTILLYDVLEHLPEPERVLGDLHGVAAEAAHIHVSVPNARHWSLVRDLVFRGTFGYTDAGHRDRTHVRWLTPGDVARLVEDAGWAVERSGPVGALRPASRALARLTSGRSAEFLVYQWQLLARARGSDLEGAR